jgi:hypothetical protein
MGLHGVTELIFDLLSNEICKYLTEITRCGRLQNILKRTLDCKQYLKDNFLIKFWSVNTCSLKVYRVAEIAQCSGIHKAEGYMLL